MEMKDKTSQVSGLNNFDTVEPNRNKDENNSGSLKRIKLDEEENDIDEEKTDTGEESSSLNPLLMHDTLYYILRRFDINSLKIFRQTCTLWDKVALREIIKEKFYLKIPENFHKKQEDEKEKDTQNMKSFLSTNNIIVKSIILQKKKDIPVFQSLNIFEQVKELKLEVFCKLEKFQHVIKKDLVNLKYLIWNNQKDVEDFDDACTFIRTVKILTSIAKPLTVSQLIFHPVEVDTLDEDILHLPVYDEILKIKMQTKKLFINLIHVPIHPAQISRISKQLEEILIASQDVLEEIILLDPLGFLSNFKMPILPKVTKFHFHLLIDSMQLDDFYRDGLLFPRGFKFNTHLPNLTEVEIYSKDEDTNCMGDLFDIWGSSFASTGIASKVHTLVYNVSTDFDRSSLTSTFPFAKIQEQKTQVS